MDNQLWLSAVETEYNVIENRTTERLKHPAVIGAFLKSKSCSHWGLAGAKDEYICVMSASRTFEGKECPSDTPIYFYISFYKYYMGDRNKYDKMIIFLDGERKEMPVAKSEVDELPFGSYWVAPWTSSKIVINGLADDHLGYNKKLETRYQRNITTMLPPTLTWAEIFCETKDFFISVDNETMINANGGEIPFADGSGSFQIEGIQGFLKRVCHFFVDETYYTDYCVSYYKREQELIREAPPPRP